LRQARKPPVYGLAWPWPFLTEWTFGRRYGEVYSFGAGTGVGKSDLLNTVVAQTILAGEKFAAFNYESAPAVSLKAIVGKMMRRRFHIPHPTRGVDPGGTG
jgi:twinkle protein